MLIKLEHVQKLRSFGNICLMELETKSRYKFRLIPMKKKNKPYVSSLLYLLSVDHPCKSDDYILLTNIPQPSGSGCLRKSVTTTRSRGVGSPVVSAQIIAPTVLLLCRELRKDTMHTVSTKNNLSCRCFLIFNIDY